MFAGHDPFLVALSVAVAILGGYTGFGLAARLRASPGANRRLLLAVGAAFLALGIWTMQFIGMLAAPMPPDVVYLTLPTVSFARPHKYVRCDPALPSTGSAEFFAIWPPSAHRFSDAQKAWPEPESCLVRPRSAHIADIGGQATDRASA